MRQLISAIRRRLTAPTETLEGYEHPELVEVHFQKTKAYDPVGSWPDMIGVSSVLDFGGACGIHYKRAALQSPDIRWAVVETPAMAARASELSTERLRFFTSISDAAGWLGSIDMMHSNGALQYVPQPETTLETLCGLRARTMLWDRMALSNHDQVREQQVSHLIDNGPGKAPLRIANKLVRYERTLLPETDFIASHKAHRLVERRDGYFRFTRLD